MGWLIFWGIICLLGIVGLIAAISGGGGGGSGSGSSGGGGHHPDGYY